MNSKNDSIILTTERLTLRKFEPSDAKAMEDVLCDKDVMLYSMGVQTIEDVEMWIANTINDYNDIGVGNWAIVENEKEQVIGYCGLTFSGETLTQGVELNYRLAKSFWNKGYATEIATSVIHYAKSKKLADRLYAVVDPTNEKSLNVVRKLGMAFENEIWVEEYDYPDYLFTLYFDD